MDSATADGLKEVDRLQPLWALAKRDRSDALWQMLAGSADAKP